MQRTKAPFRADEVGSLLRPPRIKEARARLAPLSVDRLWGVGKVAGQRLRSLGFGVIGELQALEPAEAVARLGEDGRRLWRLANGIDDRRVMTERETKSISAEITFEHDVGDAADANTKVSSLVLNEPSSAAGVTIAPWAEAYSVGPWSLCAAPPWTESFWPFSWPQLSWPPL